MKPLVSVVTPSYNQAQFLEDTIRSVLAQDYPNIEYIVVDGGSNDGSVEIIKKYADRLSWWVSEPDSGQADAINKGLKRARGDIVAWLNSDDIYFPDAISEAVEALQAHPGVGMVFGNAISMDANGYPLHNQTFDDWGMEDLMCYNIICQPAVFMRRDTLEKVGFLDHSYHYLLDHHLWLRITNLAGAQHVDSIWAGARHHRDAKNVARAAEFSQEVFRVLDWMQGQATLTGRMKKLKRRIWGGAYNISGRYLLEGGLPGPALRDYWRATIRDPSLLKFYWHRMIYALLSLIGWSGAADWYYSLMTHFRPEVGDDLRLRNWPGLNIAANNAPIVITGVHRSGTTWVGKMIAASRDVIYLSEPLNLWHRPGVMRTPVAHWYQYICDENEQFFLPALRETLGYRYHISTEIFSIRTVKDIGRMLRDMYRFIKGNLTDARPLLKDPFAVFSSPWFSRRLGAKIVIVVRHPVAFVSSLKRLGWTFDFQNILDQPLLMRDHLGEFRPEMEAMLPYPDDIVGQGSLLWRMVYSVVDQYRTTHPEFVVIRHEDISLNPVDGYQDMYAALGLAFTPWVRRKITQSTHKSNPKEQPEQREFSTQLDSRANLLNWKHRLTDEEIARVHELTADVAAIFYSDEEWQQWTRSR
ncbi:MAG: glycosyltransferase [Anaerolineae bacterium]|nr:glycosyltransferase [Anaerolineae bacterium]